MNKPKFLDLDLDYIFTCCVIVNAAGLVLLSTMYWGVYAQLCFALLLPLGFIAGYHFYIVPKLQKDIQTLKAENQKKDREIASFIEKRKQLLSQMSRLQTKIDNTRRWTDQEKK